MNKNIVFKLKKIFAYPTLGINKNNQYAVPENEILHLDFIIKYANTYWTFNFFGGTQGTSGTTASALGYPCPTCFFHGETTT